MEEKITDTVQENYLGENTASGVDSKENTDSGEIVDSDNELVKSMNVIQDMITDKKYELKNLKSDLEDIKMQIRKKNTEIYELEKKFDELKVRYTNKNIGVTETKNEDKKIVFSTNLNCFKYKNVFLSINKVTITRYFGIDENIIVPEKLDKKLVIGISEKAFANLKTLKNVVIGDNITEIEQYAFVECTGLRTVHIPNSVIAINEGTFMDCRSLTYINIPESVQFIGKSAFSGCTNLREVVIPRSITAIENHIFAGCCNLEKITLSERVRFIEDNAFSDCSKLTIYCKDNGYIPRYAKNRKINFEII